MKMKLLTALLVSVLLIGCAGISTSFDYDVEADFTNLSSFAWIKEERPSGVSDLDYRRARSAVEDGLLARGYEADENEPDFLVALGFATEDKVRIREYGTGYRSRGMGFGTSTVDVDEYKEGTLILDFLQPDSKQLLWRGAATGTVNDQRTPEERTERVRSAVAALLDKFPPGS